MIDNIVRNIAPFINDRFLITSPWWTERNGTIHRGLDIATSGSKNVYSILTGSVHSIGYDNSQGNWIVVWDNRENSATYGYASLYMHLAKRPLLEIGQNIEAGDYIGLEGKTGDATGVHLHVEMQDISKFNNKWHWSYNKSDYLDPTKYMGIDNIKNTWWIYNGIVPPTPTPTEGKKNNFKWVLYAKKLRTRRQ